MQDCNPAGTVCGSTNGAYGPQGTPGNVYGTNNSSGDVGVFGAVVAGVVALVAYGPDLISAIGNFFDGLFGGGVDAPQSSSVLSARSSINGDSTLYPSLQAWENGLGGGLLRINPDTTTDPLGQHHDAFSSTSPATTDQSQSDRSDQQTGYGDVRFPVGANPDGGISLNAVGDAGDAFVFGFAEAAPPVPGRWPYVEGAVLAGANATDGAYLGALRLSGEQVGGFGVHYSEGQGSEYTVSMSDGRLEKNSFIAQEGTGEVLGAGRYQSGAEAGSYVYISLEGVGLGLGLSDSALNVLVRPLAPTGSFRNPRFGYGDEPPY